MAEQRKRRVVVTGLGVVAPNGIGVPAFWQATATGRSGITPFDTMSAQNLAHPLWVAGSVRGFLAEEQLERKLVNRTDRMTHFALSAVQEALNDAQLVFEQHVQPQRAGAVIANSLGGVDFVLRQLHTLYTRGPRFVSAYTAIAWLNVANVGHAAIRYGLQGYCKTPVNDSVGGLDALGLAYRAIQRGTADVLIAGGAEAFLHPLVLLVLRSQGLCFDGDDPNGYRPFDQRAAGLVVAEGAGICILEEYELAKARGATIYGEIVGYGQTNDAHSLSGPSSNGRYYAKALQQALSEGGLQREDLAYIQLDGHADPRSDAGEVAALQQTFGDAYTTIPVSVPRTMIGHSYAAAGALDAITALLALKHGCIPPTINCEQPEPGYDLKIVHEVAQPLESEQRRTVLLGGRGVGGINVALALQRID